MAADKAKSILFKNQGTFPPAVARRDIRTQPKTVQPIQPKTVQPTSGIPTDDGPNTQLEPVSTIQDDNVNPATIFGRDTGQTEASGPTGL